MNVLHHGSSRGRQIFTLGLLLSALQIGHTAQINVFGPPGSEKFGDAVVLLPNGNFVVTDPNFDLVNPSVSNVGAVSVFSPKGQMISRITGRVENAYMGQITVLVNGNFVITSANGDVTWGSSIEGVSGVVSASNSLINRAAITKVFALTNGHYVVASPYWSSATAEFAGAVTWGNGRGGTVGEISINNSLIGDAFDRIGLGDEPTSVFPGVVPLANGNYVVSSTHWSDEDSLFVGAATFCKGDVACGGQVSAENSLVGQTLHDRVGSGGIYALKNGNYVVGSYEWDRLDPVPVANVAGESVLNHILCCCCSKTFSSRSHELS